MPGSDPSRLQSELEITTPWSSANHWPDDGVDAEVPDERGRDRCAADVLRLARERHVEAAGLEPAEHVEAARALLILLKVRERVG